MLKRSFVLAVALSSLVAAPVLAATVSTDATPPAAMTAPMTPPATAKVAAPTTAKVEAAKVVKSHKQSASRSTHKHRVAKAGRGKLKTRHIAKTGTSVKAAAKVVKPAKSAS